MIMPPTTLGPSACLEHQIITKNKEDEQTNLLRFTHHLNWLNIMFKMFPLLKTPGTNGEFTHETIHAE